MQNIRQQHTQNIANKLKILESFINGDNFILLIALKKNRKSSATDLLQRAHKFEACSALLIRKLLPRNFAVVNLHIKKNT